MSRPQFDSSTDKLNTMVSPPQNRDPAPTLPSIIVPTSCDRYRSHASHHGLPVGRSHAISISGTAAPNDVSPSMALARLPFGLDQPSTIAENINDKREYGHGSFTGGHGSMNSPYHEDRSCYQRRDTTSNIGERDEGYASYSSTDRLRQRVPTDLSLHPHPFQFQSAADIHGDSLKKKLGPSLLPKHSPFPSLLSASANELFYKRPSAGSQFPPALSVPAKLPIPTCGILGSPIRLTDIPIHSTIPSRSSPFHARDRSPKDSSDIDRSPRTRPKGNNIGDASGHSDYGFNGAKDMGMEDRQWLKRFHISDAYVAGSQKRRATSLYDENHLAMSLDMPYRRDFSLCGSPQSRITTHTRAAIILSVPKSQPNSHISTVSMSKDPTSISTANPVGRRSPIDISPGRDLPTSYSSPYTVPVSLHPSPRTSISNRGSIHSRTISGASTRKITEVQKPHGTKAQGFFVCECCPKKPKKFETIEKLNAHEAEKKHECSFCGNRFKTKNEAKRHQQSLHERRFSWSCSVLSGYYGAFHDSTNTPGETDTCGYCGDEFPRSGCGPDTGVLSGGNAPRHATNQDWNERIKHLQEVHKFRECKSSSKFYRADHFRQHVKHSHAGVSGKWTDMLESACMLDEDPTPR